MSEGSLLVTSPCFGCGRLITYNPLRVPSIRVNPATGAPDPTGKREPVCLDGIHRANPRRIANGVPPITVHPEAYAPLPEHEMAWE